MTREFDVVAERDEAGYYVASVPALRGCHTQAKSLDELMSRIEEAIECAWRLRGASPGVGVLSALNGFGSAHEPFAQNHGQAVHRRPQEAGFPGDS